MARTISDEELQLKRRARRRLIGAVVLVTAIVVVLPMVLDTEPKPVSRDISVQIPPPRASDFAPKASPMLAAPPPAAAAPAGTPAKAPATEAPPPKAEAPSPPKPATTATAKGETPPARPPVKAAKPAGKTANGKFVVQVIALADANRAKRMRSRIEDAGIPAYTEIVKTAKGDVTRVRAGPFATHGAAEKARDRLKALGMNGNIIAR